MVVTPVEIRPRPGEVADTSSLTDRTNLTRAQFLMWLGQQIDPDVPLYNMVETFRIAGPIDHEAFQRAFESLVGASDALRTTITTEVGVPMQSVAPDPSGQVPVVDVRDRDDPEEAALDWIERRKVRPLVLDERLWDTALLRVADDVTVWYLCVHHIVSDAHAFTLLFRATEERYRLAVAGRLDEARSLEQFADYIRHEREFRSTEAWATASAYWDDRLAEPVSDTEFYGRTVSHRSTRTDRLVVDVDSRCGDRIREIARRLEFASISNDLTLGTIWATLLFTLLHRVTGRTSIRVGTPFLGRSSPAFRDTIGLFIEIGVLDAEIEPGDTFTTLAARLRNRATAGLRSAKPGIGSTDINRSYDVLLNNVTSRFDDFAGLPVETDWVHTGHGDRDHALRLQISDFDAGSSFRLHFDVNAELFGPHERTWLLDQFDAVLDAFVADPGVGIGDFDLVGPDLRRTLLTDFNATGTDDPPASTAIELFRRQVGATPEATAVEDRSRSVTYGELDAESRAVAAALRGAGVRPGDLVAISGRRSVEVVAGMLGVLSVGAAYVPIDPGYPVERRQLMLDDAAPVAVVFAGADSSGLRLDAPVIDVSDLPPADPAARQPDARCGHDDLAYVIYTSGSTGRPKGTEITHRGLVNYLWWAKHTYQDDVPLDFALYSSLSFDLTVTSLFVPLVSGGRVVVYDRPDEADGLEILDVFADDRVDVVKLTPAHLALLLESPVTCRRIRRLIVGGENFRTDLAQSASALFEHDVEIYNEYGPTEAVVGCMVHRYDPATDTGPSVPIGRPAANTAIYLLDRHDRPVPPGVAGEIVISGDGVARGYRDRPDLTAERFGNDPFRPGARWYRTGDLARWGADGRLEFLGRNDDQVKIRGARIELGEIEAAALEHEEIEQVTVDVVSFGDDDASAVEHCITCGLPSSYPGAGFDARGECADCRAFAVHRDDVAAYFRSPDELRSVLNEVSGAAGSRPYDCLVLVSGGKDSTYMLYQLVREFGVRPLVFTLDNGFIADTALGNVRRACADLGVDLHVGSTPHMNAIFADSIDRHANVCDGCYKTIYTLSMGLARRHDIDTIVTGLSRGQLFETRLADTFAAREFDPDRIDDWVMEARKAYHHIDDAVYQLLENDLFDDDTIFDHIGFVDFYRYVDVGLDEVYGYLEANTVWTRPPDTGRSTNCLINDAGIYVHTKQRGYHNYALPYSWDVRLGHKRRADAIEELDDEIDTARMRTTLLEIGRGQLFDDLRSDKRLAAYYVSDRPLGPGEVRRHLADRLPDFMVPTYLVRVPELPLTVNGKVDRAALPDPRSVRQSEARFVPATTETQRRLVDIWSSTLHAPEIGIADNFFDLGGDSITGIQIVAAARRLGWELSARDVFSHQTIAQLAALIDAGESSLHPAEAGADGADRAPAPADIEPTESDLARVGALLADDGGLDAIDDVYPLTPTQLGMIYHTLATSSRAYLGQGTCTVDGPLDVERLRRAWELSCDRHPATRARFLWGGLDVPLQVVQRDSPLPWTEYDWRGVDDEEVQRDLASLRAMQREAGFELAAGLLMNVTVVLTDDTTHLIWNCHHAVLDAWSTHLLFREVLEIYEDLADGDATGAPSLPPFRDHVASLARQDADSARRHWQPLLDGIEAATPLPLQPASGLRAERHERVVRTIDPALAARVDELARRERVTLSTVATAAWALVLSRTCRTDDVLFGTTVSGREDGIEHVEDMIGMFITTLPTRVGLDHDATVGDWLREIQLEAIESRRHGHLALPDLQRLTGIPSGQPMFDSIVVVENYPAATPDRPLSVTVSALEMSAPSNYPLALLLHPAASLDVEMVYDPHRIGARDVGDLIDRLECALRSLTGGPGRRLGDLDVVPDDEKTRLAAWSIGPTRPAPDRLVHEMIDDRARRDAGHVAVRAEDGELTYGALAERSDRLARLLRARGLRGGQCAGVIVSSSTSHVVAVLGIWKAGGAYVPLDSELPAVRLATMIDDTGIELVLTDGPGPPATVSDVAVVDVAAVSDDGAPPVPPDERARPDDLAYVIHTSGSTGRPKGVAVTHANIAHSTSVRSTTYPEPVGAFLLLSSFAFDSSMVGLLWTLCSGGTLVIPAAEHRHRLRHLADLIETSRITHLLALPSLYRLLLDEHEPAQLDSLGTVIVAGEACPNGLARRHSERCAGATLYNEYGPTEATVWSHVGEVTPDDDARVPIGRPIPNTAGVVLDQTDHLAATGVAGELVVGGAGVAAGYLHRPALTEESFVTLPGHVGVGGGERWYRTGDLVRWRRDGVLEFLGRLDGQVKIRGFRVELSEVDGALGDHPDVHAAAAVVLAEPEAGHQRLVGCYAAHDADTAGTEWEQAWRSELADRLPHYMVPSTLLRLDRMPLTSTGKVDRTALAAVAAARLSSTGRSVRAPSDGLERDLLVIWCRVLDRDDIGIDDDFFDLGGNSLDAMRLFSRIEQATGRELLLSSLFEAPTIAEFAELLRDAPDAPENTSLVPIKPSGHKRPFFYVPPYEISVLELGKIGKHFEPDRPFYGLQPSGLRADEVVHHTVEEMATHYIEAIKDRQSHGPYLVGGHCDGSWVAHEMAVQLADRGEDVVYLAMVDLPPTHRELPTGQRARRILERLQYYARDRRLVAAIRWQLKLRFDKLVLLRFGSAASRRVRTVRLAHEEAFERYGFEHDDRTPVHLVRSSELAVFMDEMPWYDRLRADGNDITVTDITSTHAQLLNEPATERLADVLAAGIVAAEGTT